MRDHEDFLDRLAILLPETKTACYAWALLQNHAHFLFRTGAVPLARLMRRLLTGYAVERGAALVRESNYALMK
jgi:putative transposase